MLGWIRCSFLCSESSCWCYALGTSGLLQPLRLLLLVLPSFFLRKLKIQPKVLTTSFSSYQHVFSHGRGQLCIGFCWSIPKPMDALGDLEVRKRLEVVAGLGLSTFIAMCLSKPQRSKPISHHSRAGSYLYQSLEEFVHK